MMRVTPQLTVVMSTNVPEVVWQRWKAVHGVLVASKALAELDRKGVLVRSSSDQRCQLPLRACVAARGVFHR